MPVSEEQRAANRANASHSTGPRSPEGKARSAQNACKHGFTASKFVVVRLEDLDEVAHLKHDLVAVYQPVNSQELFAIERMAIAQQTILRAARLESGLFTTCLNETLDGNDRPMMLLNKVLTGDDDGSVTRAQNRNYLMGEGFHRMVRQSNSWQLFMRYQAQAERHYRRALEEFDRLKALRQSLPEELPNEPISEAQPEEMEVFLRARTNPFPPPDSPPAPLAPTPAEPQDPERAAASAAGQPERGSAPSQPATGVPNQVPDPPSIAGPARPADPNLPPIPANRIRPPRKPPVPEKTDPAAEGADPPPLDHPPPDYPLGT